MSDLSESNIEHDPVDDQHVNKPWGIELKAYCMLMHLSQLANFVIPLIGLALPIVMWVTNKDEFNTVDQHGKVIMNWILSCLIYYAVCTVLALALVGIVGFFVVALINFIFILIGAIKANNGELWKYPLSISFLK